SALAVLLELGDRSRVEGDRHEPDGGAQRTPGRAEALFGGEGGVEAARLAEVVEDERALVPREPAERIAPDELLERPTTLRPAALAHRVERGSHLRQVERVEVDGDLLDALIDQRQGPRRQPLEHA